MLKDLSLNYSNNGLWAEDDSVTAALTATLTPTTLNFSNSYYNKADHYSKTPQKLNFQSAKLQLINKADTVYLAGNLSLFSQDQKEPEKPLYVILKRVTKTNSNDSSKINFVSQEGTVTNQLHAYPNPFSSIVNIDFELKNDATVSTQVLTLDGKMVYTKPIVKLLKGAYTIPLSLNELSSGSYIVKLLSNNTSKVTMIIKK